MPDPSSFNLHKWEREGFVIAYIVIYTVGSVKYPEGHTVTTDFFEKGNAIFQQAMNTGDMIDALPSNRVPIPDAAKGEGAPILTLTIWKSLSALFQFSYSGVHSQALRDRNKWMQPHEDHKPYVLWWTEKVMDVSWLEAFKRYDYYLEKGSTPFAFDFKRAFDEKGEACRVK
ncbi:DUF3291 domain-containing protein [Metabacillus sp. GX 13764]|uniref:DUF3291 domain-containing protein n=1 Tax=Metabacillus kandeliae TaxID=2900151 RepID=UPI001E3DC005|nr:DUF3291 domain-containing protein [Metabacillus kandeliae]MCD7034153.1 DUF3291 domain-containing protein [Metabacillus kandeliae]